MRLIKELTEPYNRLYYDSDKNFWTESVEDRSAFVAALTRAASKAHPRIKLLPWSRHDVQDYKGTLVQLFDFLRGIERKAFEDIRNRPQQPGNAKLYEMLRFALLPAAETMSRVWELMPFLQLTAEHEAHLAHRRIQSGVRLGYCEAWLF